MKKMKAGEKNGYDVAENLTILFRENWHYTGYEVLPNGNEKHNFYMVTKREYFPTEPIIVEETDK